MTEASYSPEMITAMANNANIIKAYPAIVTASLGSQFPMASLRLNSSLYFAAARQTFNPGVIKSLGSGLAWGVAGAVVDGASDQYENSIYNVLAGGLLILPLILFFIFNQKNKS